MLCVEHHSRLESEHTHLNMPADYSSYLLSTSPPGFDLAYTLRERYEKKNKRKVKASIFYSDSAGRDPFSQELDHVSQGLANLLSDFQSHKSHSLPIAYTGFQNETNNKNSNNNSDDGLKKKAVTFADELGKSLVEVRIVYENTDEPPTFTMPSEILSTVAEGAQAGITDTPPLTLSFTQPASNYKDFRAKLENNCVSLENVIVKEYNLLGTIKVKNIAFEKKVTLRYTCDSWATLCDIEAKYVPTAAMPSTSSTVPYDTFSFQLSIPPTFDPKLKIQFSICYETDGRQFWDNNDGKNYEVVSANRPTQREKTQDNDRRRGGNTSSPYSRLHMRHTSNSNRLELHGAYSEVDQRIRNSGSAIVYYSEDEINGSALEGNAGRSTRWSQNQKQAKRSISYRSD